MDHKMKLRSGAKPPLNSTTTTQNNYDLRKRKLPAQKKQSIRKKKNTKNKNSISNSGLYLDEAIIIQMLSKLPVKSLMRFKCVCTRWENLISEDPWLIELQLSHSSKRPCLLVILEQLKTRRYTERRSFRLERFLTVSLPVESIGRPTTTMMHTLSDKESDFMIYDDIIGPVNGLFGLVENLISVVTIYNFSTRELVQECSRPTSFTKLKGKPGYNPTHEFQTYFFGFDSTTKKYKVICIWRVFECLTDRTVLEFAACEVFTLGCSSHTWKKIDDEVLPPCCFEELSIHANNSIYWRSSVEDLRNLPSFVEQLAKIDRSIDEVLVAFDLGSERFRVIPIPSFVPPRQSSHLFSHTDRGYRLNPVLLEVCGCVVISNRPESDIIELYVFEDDCVNKENANMMNWTKESIELPIALNYAEIDIHPLPGSDYIFLMCILGHTTIRSHCLYSYNRKKKTFKLINVFDEWGSYSYHPFMYSTFVESLSPFRT